VTKIKFLNFNGQHVGGIDEELIPLFIKAVTALIENSPNLVILQLIACAGVNQKFVRNVAMKCLKLEHLNLEKSLDLEGVYQTSFVGQEIPLEFLELKYLRVNGTNVHRLNVYVPSLEKLYTYKTPLASLKFEAPDASDWNLRVLDISDSPVPAEDIDRILKMMWQLRVFKHKNNNLFNSKAFAWHAFKNNRVTKATLIGMIQYIEKGGNKRYGVLDISGLNDFFSDEHLGKLAGYIQREMIEPEYKNPIRVHELRARGCLKITPKGLLSFMSRTVPILEIIDVHTKWRPRSTEPVLLETDSKEANYLFGLLTVQPDGTLMSISEDGEYCEWDEKTGKLLSKIALHENNFKAFYYNATYLLDGRLVLSRCAINGDDNTSVIVYDPSHKTCTPISTIAGETRVQVVGKQWLAVHNFESLEIFKINGEKIEPYHLFEDTKVDHLTVSPDGDLTTCYDSTITVWNLDQKKPYMQYVVFESPIKSRSKLFNVLSDDKIYWCFTNNHVHIVDMEYEDATATLALELKHDASISSITDLPNDELLVCGSNVPVSIYSDSFKERVYPLRDQLDFMGRQDAKADSKQICVTSQGHIVSRGTSTIEVWQADSTCLDLKFGKQLPVAISATFANGAILLTCSEFKKEEEKVAWKELAFLLGRLAPSSTVTAGDATIKLADWPASLMVLKRLLRMMNPEKNAEHTRRSRRMSKIKFATQKNHLHGKNRKSVSLSVLFKRENSEKTYLPQHRGKKSANMERQAVHVSEDRREDEGVQQVNNDNNAGSDDASNAGVVYDTGSPPPSN